MQLSKASGYGLHALMYMVKHLTQMPVHSKIIARSEGISSSYLTRILGRLVEAHILATNNDDEKEYYLTKQPGEINILEILEAIEGKSFLTTCFLKCSDECGGTSINCQIYKIWQQSMQPLHDSLIKTSLADVAWSHPLHRFGPKALTPASLHQNNIQENIRYDK